MDKTDSIRREMLAALSTTTKAIRVSILYRTWLLFITILMVLLPLIYIGLIGLAGYSIYYHATVTGPEWTEDASARAALIIYLAPLIIGSILVLFMIKPLFAPKQREAKEHKLSPKDEPFLFEYIAKLCDAIGAPRPKEICVNCDLNASASFRRGMLSFFGKELTLTIGTPLVTGLNGQEFTGVLAHEFGHFSQGIGMRLTYIIRSVSHWFARIVYERDAWDKRLKEWSEQNDIRIGIIFYAARFFVWVTRKILWVLMMIGVLFSSLMLRQMEFDADSYEARIAGSKSLADAMVKLDVLALAVGGAHSDLNNFWAEHRLPDDYANLVKWNITQIPEEVVSEYCAEALATKTGFLDTHPSSASRIKKAKALNQDGIFNIEAPAELLFSDFEQLSKKVSLLYYRQLIGKKVKQNNLEPISNFIETAAAETNNDKSMQRYFFGRDIIFYRVLFQDSIDVTPPEDLSKAVEILKLAREKMSAALLAYAKNAKQREENLEIKNSCEMAKMLSKAGYKLPKGMFGLKTTTSSGIAQAEEVALTQVAALEKSLLPFEVGLTKRITLALRLVFAPQLQAKLENAELFKDTIVKLYPIAKSLGASMPKFYLLETQYTALSALTQQVEEEVDEQTYKTMKRATRSLNTDMRDFIVSFEDAPYPFEHAQKDVTVSQYLIQIMPKKGDIGKTLDATVNMLNKFMRLYAKILGELVSIAEMAEVAVGLPQLPEPPPVKNK